MFLRPADHITEAIASERDLVVGDPWIADGLTRAGLPATTFVQILGDSDIANLTHLAGELIVLVVTRPSLRKAAAVANRLDRLGLRFRAIRELLDRGLS